MSKDKHNYDDFLREKLDNHASSVPDNLFERLMSDRAVRGQLDNFESPAPESLFDALIRNREGSDETPSDAPIRERLLDHESAVSKHTFNAIIDERERRRRALIWRSAAVAALLLLAYFMVIKEESLIDNQKEKTINNKQIEIKNKESVVINKENDESSVKNTLSGDKNAVYTEGGIFNENTNTKKANSEWKNSALNNTSVSKAALTNPTTNLLAAQKTAHSKDAVSNSTNYSKALPASKQTIIPTTIFSALNEAAVLESNVDNRQDAISNGQDAMGKMQDAISNRQDAISKMQNAQLETQSPKFETSNTVNRPVFDFENLSIFKVKNIAIPVQDLKNPCAGPGDGCPTFGKRKRQRRRDEDAFYVDVYGAPEYAFRRLSQNLPESVMYLNARDSVEKSWYALSAGVRASYVLGNGLAIRAGLVYAQTNEIAVFDSTGIGKKVITETYPPRSGGGQDTVRKIETTSGIFRSTRHNRYRSIDIPVQLGFEFPMSDYWSFSVNGGVNVNLSASYKVGLLNTQLTRDSFNSRFGAENPVFRKTLGLSLFGSVAAYRQLSGNLQLVIEPSVRHYFKPITRNDYALKQSYTNAGLILGLRYRF